MWTRWQLKENAKEKLKNYYWNGFLAVLIYSFIGGAGGRITYSFTGSFNSLQRAENPAFEYTHEISGTFLVIFFVLLLLVLIVGILFGIFLGNPLSVGIKHYFLLSGETKTEKIEIQEIFFAFRKGHYLNVVKVMFFRELYVFLWSLLFFVPGIIKSYEYSMIPYLLAEDPLLDRKQAFDLSWEMTDGNKWGIFVLELSFLGWLFVGAMLCGIGMIFVQPYIEATYVELFLALKARVYYNKKGRQRPELPDWDRLPPIE